MIASLLSVLLLLQQPAATDSLSLQQCYNLAREHQPALNRLMLDNQAAQLRKESIDRKNYPQLSMSGRATYQDEVTSIPGAPFTISKDQYKLVLQVDQELFDGGAARAARKVSASQEKVDKAQVNVQLYQVHNEVNQAFFEVLLARTNLSILDLKKQVLVKQLSAIRSRVKNGMALPGAAAALQAELLVTGQQILSTEYNEQSALGALSIITGQSLDSATVLSLPFDTTKFTPPENIERPELDMYQARRSLLDREMNQTKVRNVPRLSAFAQGIYGRPGLNIFKNQFEPNYMIGVRLTWNIWDWHEARRQRSLLSIQKKIINTKQETFLQNVHIGMRRERAQISKYRALMNQDTRIITLRKQVEEQSASRLRNGTITPGDYLEDLNRVYQARLSREQHRLQWTYAVINYMTQTGIL